MPDTTTALDLFAGTGWGVACRRLGIREMGVELMPEAVATRTANGMPTIYHDVWEGLVGKLFVPFYSRLIASPPCQTFSLAGSGAGRAALDAVLEAIRLGAYKRPAELVAFGEEYDPRTALVLTPLAHVWRDRPEYVVLEQVPTVLPVWHAYADVMTDLGYDVKVAILHAEQYGAPQTRKRAILVGRLGGPVALPTPTHSRYYQNDPTRLDNGVLPWVSAGRALGMSEEGGSLYHGVQKNSARRPLWQPAATIAFGHDRKSVGFAKSDEGDHLALRAAKREGRFVPITAEQAATLQTYPAGFEWVGNPYSTYLQIGNAVPPLLAQAVLAALVS